MTPKKWKNGPQKLLIIGPNPFFSQSSQDQRPTAQNWFFILWNLGTRHLFSYLWYVCANCINLSTKVCLFFVSLLTLELVFFTQWQSVRWLLFFSCLVWHQGQIPSTILFNAHLLLLLTQAGFTLKNVEIQRVNLEKMGKKSKINFF